MTSYFCSCAWDDLHTAREQASIPDQWPAVAQPGTSLEMLYFCEACHELRCNDCIAWEVSSCYCPHCLYEVPSTSVQAQKAQCARNCYTCPECMHVLSVQGSDPRPGLPLTHAEASQPVAPFFLACSSCRWESKRANLTAEKPSRLSGVLPSPLDRSPEQHAFDEMVQHLAQAVRPHPPPLPTPTVPRVLADLPSLPAHYWQGKRALPTSETDELPLPSLHATRSQNKQMAREARRVDRVARSTTNDGSGALSRMDQRYAMPLEQPYETSALRPQRVRLLAKLCKRCPECRHILVRPEFRTSSSQYKLRLLAKEFVPSLRVRHVDDETQLVLTNPLMEAVDVALYTPDAWLSSTHISLPGASDTWDAPLPVPDAPLGAQSVCLHRNTATVRTTGAASIPIRVTWTVLERTHAYWVWVST